MAMRAPHPQRAAATSERGATLLELMIAVVSVIAVLGAVMSGAIQNSRQRRANAELNLATLAALDTIEELRSVPFATLPSLDGSGFDVPDANGAPGGLRAVAGDADGLPGVIRVAPHLVHGTATLYLVTVTVEWSGVQRRSDLQFQQYLIERK